MVHGILQFTPSIAFRYVLHRCKSRDIRCRESFSYMKDCARQRRPRNGRGRALFVRFFLGAFCAGGSLFDKQTTHVARKGPCASARKGKMEGAATGPRPPHHPREHMLDKFAGFLLGRFSTMILPQVHLRKPCYDFSFL